MCKSIRCTALMKGITSWITVSCSRNQTEPPHKESPLLEAIQGCAIPIRRVSHAHWKRSSQHSATQKLKPSCRRPSCADGYAMKIAAEMTDMGWLSSLELMYRWILQHRRQLIAELLEETDPLDFIPQPKAQKSSQEMGQAIYQRPEFNAAPVSTATADDEYRLSVRVCAG